MKAKSGNEIEVTKNVYFGSAYGLIEIAKGTIMTVSERNSSNDGVRTEETITQTNELGTRTIAYNVWDSDYILLS